MSEIRVPDIGTDEKVEVVEILVAAGESVAFDDGLITLESDKATMDVPSPVAGVVQKIAVKVGDQVGEGDLILELEEAPAEESEDADEKAAAVDDESGAASEGDSGGVKADAEDEGEGEEAAPEERGDDAGEEDSPESTAEASAADSAPSPQAPPPADSGSGDHDYDIVVLGAGPGGYTAAFRAADLGKKVALVERYSTLGGVCLNVGCIPSKALLHVGRVIEEAAELSGHGIDFGKPSVDLPKLRQWKEKTIGRLTGGLATMAEKRKVDVVTGAGHFTGAHELTVVTTEGSSALTFGAAIIAAGSRVVEIPGIPYDDDRVWDSTAALELREVPEHLLVIGGGIIGLEMATVYGALGSRLTIVEMLPHLVPGCDRDLVKPLERRLKRLYKAKIHTETKVEKVEAAKGELTAFLTGERAPEKLEVDAVLVSVGRRPNGDRLNLEAAGVEANERGFIPVDNRQRTNVSHIFAIGDITGQPMLAHKASHEGKVAAEVAAGEKSAFDARVIPSVAYTDPEIAWVGLTETEAAERGTACETGSFPWSASGRSLAMGRTEGLTKILFDPETHRVLGAGIVGPNAGDLISELALAIEMDCEAADLALTVHPHPTLSETIAFAAEVYEGTITDLYLPRKK